MILEPRDLSTIWATRTVRRADSALAYHDYLGHRGVILYPKIA